MIFPRDSNLHLKVQGQRRKAAAFPSIIILVAGMLGMMVCPGCNRGPVAPELRNSPVYNNRREGFRFLVPDGWKQTASANLPAGNLETELFLVQYDVPSREAAAQVQVLCCQDRDGKTDLTEVRSRPAFGVERWTIEDAPAQESVGGREGTWIYLTGRVQERKMGQEVLCFRKNGRIYSFVGTFDATDEPARQTIRRAFKSIVWK